MPEPDPPSNPVPPTDDDNDLDDGNPAVAEEPEGGPGHPLRASDVSALLSKHIA